MKDHAYLQGQCGGAIESWCRRSLPDRARAPLDPYKETRGLGRDRTRAYIDTKYPNLCKVCRAALLADAPNSRGYR